MAAFNVGLQSLRFTILTKLRQNDLNTSLRTAGSQRRIMTVFAALSFLIIIYTIRITVIHSPAVFQPISTSSHPFSPANDPSPTSLSPESGTSLPLDVEEIRPHASNVATIIESRPLTNLAPLILHFATVLGPSWPIVVFTTDPSTTPNSASFIRAIESGRVTVQALPANTSFHVRDQVSEFLTSPWLWEALAPAPHVLLFQADSIVCANSEARVEDFLKYDFIGAPIRPGMGYGDEGMNGGLSLRNRSLTLAITKRWNWKEERDHALDPMFPPVAYEDQWFYKKMKFMNNETAKLHADDPDTEGDSWGTWEPKVRLPTQEAAMRFSVESIWYERPWGYHQVAHWHWGRRKEIDQWCPEHRLATSDKISN